MSPERWRQVKEIASDLSDLSLDERPAAVEARCGSDPDLRREVDAFLLTLENIPDTFLDLSEKAPDLRAAPGKPGAIVNDRYVIVCELARTPANAVYLANDLQLLNKPVVLKTSIASGNLMRELQALAELRHPGIVSILDTGECADLGKFIVLEYVAAGTLRQRLKDGALPLKLVRRLLGEMASALTAAHEAGILHRDVKPENVMLANESGVERAKLIDFGTARVPYPIAGATTTVAGGTLGYLAPEQLIGKASQSSDLYSLAVITYEMLTGVHPYVGSPRTEGQTKHPSEICRPLPRAAGDVLLRALDYRPQHRPADVKTFVEMFEAACDGKRSYRWPALAAVCLGCLAVLTIWVFHGALEGLLLRYSPNSHLTQPAEWQPLTNFSDPVNDPALSPDGRMLAFKRGGSWFSDPGQIFVKMLPDGEAVQLTNDRFAKMTPTFSPDGSSVFYSVYGTQWWDTWEVPVLARREPRRFLANAEGLTWIDKEHVLFSEMRGAPHMPVVTSEENRAASRDVYVPESRNGMAHFSAISPNHRSVLIVEMDGTGTLPFLPCRLAPFDGSSRGKLVGPTGQCFGAAWSPDGKWMYFSVERQGGLHLWRQRSEGGEPEQITAGPTGEMGVAPSPDGLSIVTSVGFDQTTVWVRDAKGERQISGEANATSPLFSPDGRQIFYLVGGDIWVSDLASNHAERALGGRQVTQFVLSPDGKAIAYKTAANRLWYALLDRRTPPRPLADQVDSRFINIGVSGDVFFANFTRGEPTLLRTRADGTARDLVARYSTIVCVSPDEQWVVIKDSSQEWDIAQPLKEGRPVTLCERCGAGWASNGKSFWITLRALTGGGGVTGVIPLPGKSMLPPLPAGGIRTLRDLAKVPGVRIAPHEIVSPGPNASVYAFEKSDARRNIYRIPLP